MSLRRRKPEDDDSDAWLITYADMVTLLLCFFIILFSLSVPDMKQFKKVAEALRKEGFYNDLVATEDPYEQLKEQLDLSIGASGYDQFMTVSKSDKSVNVELSSSSFFLPGEAKFTRDALPRLRMISDQILPLKDSDVHIVVEGYTDDTLVKSAQFPSSWELAGGRSANVVRYLAAQGFPKDKLSAVSFGDSKPLAPNRDATGTPIPANQDLNRRVVVRMVKGAAE